MTTVPSARRRRRTVAAAFAVAALTLTGCGNDQTPTSGEATDEPTSDSSPSGGSEPTASQDAEQTTVPLYFAGRAGKQLRLFREFRRVTGDALTEAALVIDGGQAGDPDYRTLWPGQTVERAEAGDGEITVHLNADAFTEAPDGMDEEEARLAIQQMVHTLQGVEQSRAPVRFVREGDAPSTLFGVDVSEPVERGAWDETLSMVNVTVPVHNASIVEDSMKVEGLASSFEATVPWKIRQGQSVLLEGFATAEGWMDKLHPFTVEIDVSALAPGKYTLEVSTDDPSGGAEGPGPHVDTKDIVVQ